MYELFTLQIMICTMINSNYSIFDTCGNGMCEYWNKENILSCPEDCHPTNGIYKIKEYNLNYCYGGNLYGW